METLTEAEPIDDDRGEEAEEPAVGEAEEDAGFPEVVDVVDGVAGQLGDDEHGVDEDDAECARQVQLALREVRGDAWGVGLDL